ncbi:MAG: DNA ligase-associated DEXH box helicase, partial [Pseudomonadota bacterium]|nr:DNA ligase-associated DEXH box helicase [Pseudomonadota bacterium]
MTPLPSVFAHWFEQKGWQLRDYQHTMLVEKDQHDCTLLIAPTGAGKTLSGFLPSLIELAEMSKNSELAETFGMSELAEAFGTSELDEIS